MSRLCAIVLAFWCAVSSLLLAWILLSSARSMRDWSRRPVGPPDLSKAARNYGEAWGSPGQAFQRGRCFANSAIVTGLALAILVTAGPAAAYALTRLPTPGRRGLLMLFLAGFSVPLPLLSVPLYLLSGSLERFSILGLHPLGDSRVRLALINAAAFLPFTVFVLTGYLRSVPRELEEAAAIDGCSPAGTLFRVVLPQIAPGLGTVAVLDGFEIWNEFLLAYILPSPEGSYLLPRGLYELSDQMGRALDYPPVFAGIAMSMVVPLVLFPLWERRALAGFEAPGQ